MKFYITLLLVFSNFLVFSQTKNVIFQAIGKGDVETLATMFDQHIELCFNGKIEIVDKIGATKALKAFFERNPPKSVAPMHKGVSKNNDSQYAIGQLTTHSDKTYRVYVYAEEIGGQKVIKEIRIDKE